MSYREEQHRHCKPNRTMEVTTTPSGVFVDNGVTAHLAIPCFYKEIFPPIETWSHDRRVHDHHGWPTPDHPDHSCQNWDFAHGRCHKGNKRNAWHDYITNPYEYHGACGNHNHCNDYIDPSRLYPIHLTQEGYEDVSIVFKDAPDGLTYRAWIDEESDWIVRVFFDVEVEEAITDVVKVPFAVRVHLQDGDYKKRDTVLKSKLVILPAPIDLIV